MTIPVRAWVGLLGALSLVGCRASPECQAFAERCVGAVERQVCEDGAWVAARPCPAGTTCALEAEADTHCAGAVVQAAVPKRAVPKPEASDLCGLP